MEVDEKQLHDDIEQVGWHLIGVPEDDEGPGFVYSVGLFHTFGHPEIIVFGLDVDLMFTLVNQIGEWARAGESIGPKDVREGLIDGFACAFRPVGQRWYRDYFGYATRFYGGNEFPVLQCAWPDEDHHWPWERSFNPEWKSKQPLLGK